MHENESGRTQSVAVEKIEEMDEEDDEEFSLDAFLKDGGINLEEIEAEEEAKRIKEAKEAWSMEKGTRKSKVKGREDMQGELFKTSVKMEQKEGVLEEIFSTINSAVNLVADG